MLQKPQLLYLTAVICFFVSGLAQAQTGLRRPRITARVNESQLQTLRNNVHPLARPEFEEGTVAPDLPMQRMLLALSRSADQENALEQLLKDQQDPASSRYHQWLTPEQFGQQFGVADADIQVITGWLDSHGFQVNRISAGHTVIEFSGTASQVQGAFHTRIHQYDVNGEQHIANATNPQIPAALSAVVAGVSTLHNFGKRTQHISMAQGMDALSRPGAPPEFTNSSGTHALGPADYAKIYNINPLYSAGITGAGTAVAIVARTNINVSDINSFRSVFGLSANAPQVVVNGTDPGDLGKDEEAEAVLDTTWAGAVAPGATVKLVVSKSTNSTDGVDLSEEYIIDQNLGDVMSESFGDCEANYTQAEATFYSNLAQQAASQGITYLVAAGDSGSAGCDDPSSTAAKGAISVNILASSPYVIGVGGTMFNENGGDSTYWSSTNGAGNSSALSYIPENTWNESCTVAQCGRSNAGLWAGGGGASIYFSKPSWQSGVPGIPNDNARDVPDVSLTAAGHDAYLVCISSSCTVNSRGRISFSGYSGTSAATPSFAGMMALVVQKTGARQGQANPTFYRLAAGQDMTACNASSTAILGVGTCIFNDVTAGNNAVPGESGYGTLTASFQAGVGYDLASGLGSVNAANLVNSWKSTGSIGTAIASLSATSFDFQNQFLGTPTVQVLTISNAGTAALSFSGITISGANAGDFAQTNTCSGAVANASSCTVSVRFTPTVVGSRSAVLVLVDNVSGSPQTVTLAGFGTSADGITFSPAALDFSNQKLVTWSSAQTVTISNSTTQTVSISSVALSGTNAVEFSLLNNCGTTLSSGQNCPISVIFNPVLAGVRSASLVVTDSAPGSPHVIPLSGTGVLSGSFLILSSVDGKAIEVANGSNADGALVQQNPASGSQQQQWRFNDTGDGYFTILNALTGKALDVPGGSPVDGALVQPYANNGSAQQQWQLVPVDDVYYKVVNRASGKVLDLIGSSQTNGMPIQQWGYGGGAQQLWTLVPASPCTITNLLSSNALDVSNASTSNGNLIEQWAPNGLKQQQWFLMPTGSGYFAILSRLSGRALDVKGGNAADTTPIQQWDYLGAANQQWRMVFADTTHAAIFNRATGKVLDDSNNSVSNGTDIQEYRYLGNSNQQWQLTPVLFYSIVNRASGLALDVTGGSVSSGALIEESTAQNVLEQQWQLVPAGGGYYAIMNNQSSLVLDVTGASTANGALVQQYASLSGANQQWQLVPLDGGYYEVVNRASGKVLDVIGASSVSGTNIQQWAYLASANQQWQIVPTQ